MTTSVKPQLSLPTLEKLGVKLQKDLDAKAVANEWFKVFAQNVESGNAAGVTGLLLEDAFWRDMLVLTWDFRTFQGTARISKFLKDVLPSAKVTKLTLTEDQVGLQQPYPDLAWIQGAFTFETPIGLGSGIFRIVPTKDGKWKAHALYTNLEDLKGFPEHIGPLRNDQPIHGKWPDKRRREIDFEDAEPTVLIIGAGQSGLEVAARLKHLGVSALVVEKQERIGDQWRKRYEALCLHDPVWYDHLPYIPFPASWPVWTPAPKLADWLESYAHSMELNVWTSANITRLEQDPSTKVWTTDITRSDGTKRTFKPRHVVFAVGLGGNAANMPQYPGADEFEGKIIHSTQHKTARDHVGKKVVVVGACTSGHDIAQDHHVHGIDVTLFQRSSTYIMSTNRGIPLLLGPLYSENGPPTDIADRVNASYPNHLLKLMHQRLTKDIADADQELLDNLRKCGFRLNFGEDDSGFLLMAWERGGGYYLDVGASQLIIDGKIKLKNDSQIERFTKTGIKFDNGSELPADVVIFATGYGDVRGRVRELCGDELADRVDRVWGLNAEGEINSVWRWCGVPGLYFMIGNLALCRFHSKHLALQIKATEEGVLGKRYTA